jgi:mono/diheme cytochrome c family protein
MAKNRSSKPRTIGQPKWIALLALTAAAVGAALLWWYTRPEFKATQVVDVTPRATWIADAANRSQVDQGRDGYARACASCHGANLEGQPGWKTKSPDGRYPAPPHNQSGHTWHHPDRVLFDITKFGGQATGPAGFLSGMPAFKDLLSDAEIVAILAFIKSSWPEAIRERQAQMGKRN